MYKLLAPAGSSFGVGKQAFPFESVFTVKDAMVLHFEREHASH